MTYEELSNQLESCLPLIEQSGSNSVKLELKPYLQPFEEELAQRELKALVGTDTSVEKLNSITFCNCTSKEDFLRQRLTYWQRVGIYTLRPTRQVVFEYTQTPAKQASGSAQLHRARRLRYGPHDIHEYRGKFFPQLVRSLINISKVPDGSVVLDPMCGSGTTTCEAAVMGMKGIGADMNPLSALISWVKSNLPTIEPSFFSNSIKADLDKIITESEASSPTSSWQDKDLKYLQRWFAEDALVDLSSILNGIDSVKNELLQKFYKTCLSNVVRAISWQKETDLRVRKELKPYIKGQAIKSFSKQVHESHDKVLRYLNVVDRSLFIDEPVDIKLGNAVNIDKIFERYTGEVDLLITSPPYATALPYLDTDRLSLITLGLLPRELHSATEKNMIGTREVTETERRKMWEVYTSRKCELPSSICELIESIAQVNHQEGIGFRRKNLPALLGKYFLSMLDAMRAALKLMKPGAYAYYIVGNNSTKLNDKKIEIPTDDLLFELGECAGWCKVEKIPMELLASRDIFKENRGSSETILCFQKKC